MSYRNISNPYGYTIQDTKGAYQQDLTVKSIVGYANAQGSLGNKASIPLTVPPVFPVDDVETNINDRGPIHGYLEHSSNTFVIDPSEPRDENGFPGQHSGGSYGIVAWVSKIPGGDSNFLPGRNYVARQANTTFYNKFVLAQDDLWANDAYTNMPSAYMMNGNSVAGGTEKYMILGQTLGDKAEVRFFNLALVRNDSTTFSDYDPAKPFQIGTNLNALPGTDQFQTFIPPESEAYWTSSRWIIRTNYVRSVDGTYSEKPGT